jgi:hypothetical protein
MEVSSSDASGGIVFAIYPMGQRTVRSVAGGVQLLATEYLEVTDILLDIAAAGTVKVVQDADTTGELIFKATLPADPVTNTVTHHFSVPICCQQGVIPKLFAPAGAAAAVLCGLIRQA